MSFSFGSMFTDKTKMVEEDQALPGRDSPLEISGVHHVNGNSMKPPFPEGLEVAYFAFGYQGGYTKNPTYEESCTAKTGHAEAVMVVFDPTVVSFKELVTKFFEGHDPTQYMGQGNDIGTEYRSAVFPNSQSQFDTTQEVLNAYNKDLQAKDFSEITTEVTQAPAPEFYYAEEYHQQYLSKNPNGYCSLNGTGVACSLS